MLLPPGIGAGIFELPIPVAEIGKLYSQVGDVLIIRYAKDRRPSDNAIDVLKHSLSTDGLRGIVLLIPDDLDLRAVSALPEYDAKALYQGLKARFDP